MQAERWRCSDRRSALLVSDPVISRQWCKLLLGVIYTCGAAPGGPYMGIAHSLLSSVGLFPRPLGAALRPWWSSMHCRPARSAGASLLVVVDAALRGT